MFISKIATILTLIFLYTQQKQMAIRKRVNYETTLLQSSVKSSSDNSSCILPEINTQATIGFGNCQEQLYYVTLGIGTPPQYFNLQFDTGSDVLWIPTTSVTPQGFNIADSKTVSVTNKTYDIQYVNNAGVFGNDSMDYVTLTDTQINCSCPIVLASKVSGLSFPASVIGIAGMGYLNNNNFLDVAYRAGQITSNTFALRLTATNQTSLLFYDQIPQQIISSSLFSSVYGVTDFWQTNLIGFYAGDNDWTSIAAGRAVIDSGTSLFYLNPQLTNAYIDQYLSPSLCNFTGGLNICNSSIMSTLPTLSFLFPGVQVFLQPEDYVECFNDTCYVHIYSVEQNTPQVLLGDTLFMKYTITFNKQESKIGFNGDTEQVYIIGKGQFAISQYTMIGIQIAIVLTLLIIALLLPKGAGKYLENAAVQENVYEVSSRRPTELIEKLQPDQQFRSNQ